jgi:hypothetical protein
MFVQLEPPLIETCHCTDGVGLPDAVAVNDAGSPAVTVLLSGCLVTSGLLSTATANSVPVSCLRVGSVVSLIVTVMQAGLPDGAVSSETGCHSPLASLA